MILTGLELHSAMGLNVADDHDDYPKQMLAKSLVYNAVKDVKHANGIFGRPHEEVPNGRAVLESLDKLFGLQTTVAGRLLAQQRYETFGLISGEPIDNLAIRWFQIISDLSVQLTSIPSVE